MKRSITLTRGGLLGSLIGFILFLKLTASAQDFGKLAAANNGFAFDLLKQIAQQHPRENIFISPFSVSTALQMVENGAAGETKIEMQHVLKTSGLESAALNAACKGLNQSLNSQTNVVLNLANGIWYQNDFSLKRDFVADNQNFFQAELAGVDFASPNSADVINDWANKKTRGKIKNVVEFPFPPLTKVILANGIYFKGKWAEPFDKTETKPRAFPKFKLDCDVKLNDPLKALGMGRAFSLSADFSAMADEPLFISAVKQKSFVEVNEEGTEAAAVTTVGFTKAGIEMNQQEPFEMIVDRPFLFVITDERTQSILFAGIVVEPTN